MRAAVVSAILVVAAVTAAAADTASLQVTCWPGHRVYLDGEFRGLTTADQDGLYLTGLAAGDHTVTVRKLGRDDWTTTVSLQEGGIAEVIVSDAVVQAPPAAPSVAAEAQGEVASAPVVTGAAAGTVAAVESATAVPPAPAPTANVRSAAVAPSPTPDPVPLPAAAAPTPVPEETIVLSREAPDEDTVMFAYRIRGAALSAGGTVDIRRERGGPRAPVLAFWCRDDAECSDQTSPTYPPGNYRYRVTCARPTGRRTVSFSHDVYLNVDADSGENYLIDVTYTEDSPEGCRAEIRPVVVK
jgi:hypothetical protein